MSLLDDVLRNVPEDWEDVSYEDQRYVKFQLHRNEHEYQEVAHLFQNRHIEKIERVQHPFAYGRFCLRKEQYRKRPGTTITEETVFHPVYAQDADTACEFNCDCRRYVRQENASGCHTRKPSFYQTAAAAINSLPRRGVQKAIIVVSKIENFSDTDYYPKYVVYLS